MCIRANILIVDEDEDERKMMRMKVKARGKVIMMTEMASGPIWDLEMAEAAGGKHGKI